VTMSESDFTFSFDASPGDVETMQRELAERRLNDWRRDAVNAHPSAAPFADLLVGPSKESVMDLAADLAKRQGQGPSTPEAGGHRTGPATTANSGGETPGVIPGTDHKTSATIMQEVKEGKHENNSAEARRDFIRAKLLEASPRADGAS
jgi:hypothetical protein